MFLMCEGPNFQADITGEMGVHSQQALKILKVLWPEKAHLNRSLNPC